MARYYNASDKQILDIMAEDHEPLDKDDITTLERIARKGGPEASEARSILETNNRGAGLYDDSEPTGTP